MGHMLGAVTQERLDEQRGVVQNEKRQGDNQPYGKHGIQRSSSRRFPPGASRIPGARSARWRISTRRASKTCTSGSRPITGRTTPSSSSRATLPQTRSSRRSTTYFGDIPPGPPLAKRSRPGPVKIGDRQARGHAGPRSAVTSLQGLGRDPTSVRMDADLLQLADAVLTSGKTSRLYNRLVYTDQIATDVSSSQFAGDIAGYYQIIASAQPNGDLAAVERAIEEELARFLENGPTEDELERARTRLTSGVVRGLEQVGGFGGKSDILARNTVYAGDPSFYKVSLARLESATPERVREAAARWLGAGAYNLEVRPFPQLSAANDGADRSKLPETTSFPEVSFDTFERDFLDNGMELIVAHRSAVPVVNFSLRFDAGFASDQFALPGTSSLAMAMLDEGTSERSALEISDEAALLGARISAGSGIDSSVVTLNALSANLDGSLDLYADIILNPAFPAQELDRLRKQRLAGIQQEKTQPVGMALRLFPKLLYGEDHAYSLPLTGSGTEESVAQISREALVDYHQTWFRPNNATMIVVGDTTMADIKPKLQRLFRRWDAADVPTKNISDVALRAGESIYIIDRPGAEQSVLLAANIAPSRGAGDEIAIETMNEIIGGSFTSRVNMNLREDKSWAYGAFTLMLSTKGQRPFIAYAPVQTDKTMESMAELKRELVEYLGDNPATPDELAKVKANNTLSLPGRWETASAVLNDIGQIVTYELDDDYWNTYAQNVRNLSLDQVNAAASEVIKPDNLVWVVVGDREKIESRIRELEFGEITLLDVDGNVVVPAAAN